MKEEYDFSKGKRGAVAPPVEGKERITIRLDADIIQHFRNMTAGGGSYQTAINAALREHINSKPLIEVVRKVIREELKHAA